MNSSSPLLVIDRVRRNHGLEHATLNILAQRLPRRSMAGHSDAGGFWIIGDVALEDVYDAVEEALRCLQQGDKKLAIHPNCGTNFVAAGTLAGLAGGVAMLGVGRSTRSKLERLPFAMLLATLALIFSQPLGYRLQETVTTSSEPGDLRVTEIVKNQRGGMTIYRVATRG